MKAKVDTAELKRDLKKMSKLATSLLIDQKALVMADAEEHNYDLAKHRKTIEKSMSQYDSEDDI